MSSKPIPKSEEKPKQKGMLGEFENPFYSTRQGQELRSRGGKKEKSKEGLSSDGRK